MAQFLQQQRQHQRARVVIRAIAFREIRHREARVLENAGRIAHAEQVIQLQLRQLARLLVERFDWRGFSSDKTMVVTRLLEGFHVKLRHAAPHHVAAELVGVLAHRVAKRIVAQ